MIKFNRQQLTRFIVFVCFLSTGLSIHAQTGGASVARLRLDSLDGLTARSTDTMDVELEGATLQLAAKFVGKDDEDDDAEDRAENVALRRAITGLRGVYVKGYKFTSAGQYTDANIEPIRAQLRAAGSGWSRIANLNSRKPDMPTMPDSVEVYLATDPARPDNVGGLAVLMTSEKELMIVNIVGTIDVEALSGLAGNFNIPQLKGLKPAVKQPPTTKQPR